MKKAASRDKLQWMIWGLKGAIMLAGVVFAVLHLVDAATWHKPWSYVATVGVALVPELLEWLGAKLSGRLHLAYLLFLIPSMVVGIDLDLYALWDGYDKAVHLVSGVLAAFVMLEILQNCYRVVTRNRAFVFLCMISFVALTAVGWECFEFFYDELFGGTMQELIHLGVADTMWDITAAMVGGLVASGGWLIAAGRGQLIVVGQGRGANPAKDRPKQKR